MLHSSDIAKSAPLPKTGPYSGWHWMAFSGRINVNFCFRSTETKKPKLSSSLANPLAQFQVKGVYPPMILPNSVSARVKVCGMLSQISWKREALKLFSDAVKMSLSLLGKSKASSINLTSSLFLLRIILELKVFSAIWDCEISTDFSAYRVITLALFRYCSRTSSSRRMAGAAIL